MFRPGHGVTFASEDGNFSLRVRARIQVRNTTGYDYDNDAGLRNTIEVRRLRLALSGNVFSPDIQYKLGLGFGSVESEQADPNPVYDAWVAFTHHRDLNLKVGQMMVGFDRARLVSSGGAQLVDRSLVVNELALARDVGVQLSSDALFGADWLAYSLGVFGGEGRLRVDGTFGLLYAARLQLSPFGAFDDDVEGDVKRNPKPRLAFGVGAAYNQNAVRERSTAGTIYTAPFDYTHAAADVLFKMGGFSFLGEGLYRRALERTHPAINVPPPEPIERSRNAWGWFVQSGMMVTSHVEIAARYAELYTMAGSPSPRELRELGGGVSWYIEGHPFKLQGDYFRVFQGAFDQGFHEARVQLQVSL